MNRLLIPVLMAAMAMPVVAQRMGSTNVKAPTVTTTIAFDKETKASVEFVAITWADGKMMTALADKGEAGTRARSRVNNSKNPLGSVNLSTGMDLGATAVAAGDYNLFFHVDDEIQWHLVLVHKNDEKVKHKVALNLKDAGHKMTRLSLSLQAGDEDGTASLWVGFGDKSGSLALTRSADKSGQ